MVNEYKKIVLLKGLAVITEYQFSLLKSLLASDLKLTRRMQDEYDRVKIADLMEDKFRSDAGLSKLIALFKEIPTLETVAVTLKDEKSKAKGKATMKKNKQEVRSAIPTSTTSNTLTAGVEETPKTQKRKSENKEKTGTKKKKVLEEQAHLPGPAQASTSTAMGQSSLPQVSSSAPSSTSSTENQNTQAQNQTTARRSVLMKGPLVVMVLKATEPFEFESSEGVKSRMFHATVATESQFFQVKVFNVDLKEMFTKNKIIEITNCFENKGILEINEASLVFEAGHKKIEVPNGVIKRANETPKIDHLYKGASGTMVYGLFMLHKKKVNKKNTIYEIQDNTGKIDVVGNGKWHNIKCKEGDKLRLFCFQTRRIAREQKLVSGSHSFIKKPRVTAVPKEPSNECGYHRECKEVMVLKATKPFIYEYLEGERSMFHATVATEKEFFRVKVFDISLKEKFIPNKIITISDYIGRNGFLEIYSLSCVDFASPDQKMNIPISLKQNANANPKIKYLCSQTKGKCVDGVFLVHKKTVRRGCTYYEIQDNTGKMEVVVYGRLTNIDCEEGDKLKLFCFELAFSTDKCQLRSVIHSYIEVIKARKSRTKNSQSCFKYGNFTNTSFAKAWMPGWGCK
uniref:Gamma-interferon-inducible protein 16-like isoform X5 n=1 Tax=Castor canadensis TaxID=51338 RepID=A0A8B7W188_CASCN|nr:gamma-interferon-inducible protein 16-like isoform X5 [Castor canadensis]